MLAVLRAPPVLRLGVTHSAAEVAEAVVRRPGSRMVTEAVALAETVALEAHRPEEMGLAESPA